MVPWRLLRITIVWPKLRGNVAAEFLGKFAAANNVVLGLEIETELGCVILPKLLAQKSLNAWFLNSYKVDFMVKVLGEWGTNASYGF